MATTTALAYVKPRLNGAFKESRSSGALMYVPVRIASGLFGTGGQQTNSTNKKNWQPSSITPLVDKDGLIQPEWKRFFSDLAVRKLGGANFPTLPDLTQYLTVSSAQTLFSQQINSALAQQTAAIAQSVAALLEVVKNTGAAGAAQVPAPPLAPAETNAPYINTKPFGENGSTGGGGGD